MGGLFPCEGVKGPLGFELRGVIATGLAHLVSAPYCTTVRADIYLIQCSVFWAGPLLVLIRGLRLVRKETKLWTEREC